MTVSSHIVENIIKVYTRHLLSERKNQEKNIKNESLQDIVTISDEGKKRIMEKVKNEIIEHIKSKG